MCISLLIYGVDVKVKLCDATVVAGVFHDTFHSLSNIVPEVLHPVPDCVSTAAEQSEQLSLIPDNVHSLFLSINRFERKKNITLAIDALGLSFVISIIIVILDALFWYNFHIITGSAVATALC